MTSPAPAGRGPAGGPWWRRNGRGLRAVAVAGLLGMCGLAIGLLVEKQTGTVGLVAGVLLAVLPVPVLVGVFHWLGRVESVPWRVLLFAFGWGACAATLVALLTNSLAADWLSNSMGAGVEKADALGSMLVAPVVEESMKAAPVLLLFLRRRFFAGIVSGMTVAGVTAAGFAFTENVLYLGTAFGEDLLVGPRGVAESVTVSTFFVRVVLSPFAHPLFSVFSGIGFGLVAAVPGARLWLRVLGPGGGLVVAVLLHSAWNASATLPGAAFLAVYGLFMMPVLALVTWLAVWSRHSELRMVRESLPVYAAAGWLGGAEPVSLASMRARAEARAHARRFHGRGAARTVGEYQRFATMLALLRSRASRGSVPPGFAVREEELLRLLWRRRPLAAPPTAAAGRVLFPAAAGWGAGPSGVPGQRQAPPLQHTAGGPGRW